MLDKLGPILEEYVPVNDDDIKEIEKLTNILLPKSYVEFVKKMAVPLLMGTLK